ncbi:MAG: helix-turn-helix domain-containing protein [Fimbriimonadales bacterium]|nr:MAG: hypothetical protein KatS3mg018_0256 [Fimbriimonadales bacterium]
MSRLSLNDWYRYLESQFADDGSEASAPAAEPAAPEPVSPPADAPPADAPPLEVRPETPPSTPVESPHALVSIRVPHIVEFVPLLQQELNWKPPAASAHATPSPAEPSALSPAEPPSDGPRLRKRKGRKKVDPQALVPPEADELWAKLPQYLRYLAEWTDDGVARKYYPVRGRDESREELIARLTDPVLTLEETARLLGVCPATVRRYTDRGWLHCFRTEGNQRRFRLSDIVAFLEEQALRQPRGNRNAPRESDTP